MATIRRASRRRLDSGNSIEQAWDLGAPPPPEAHDPASRDTLIGAIFFRWAERRPQWVGEHHPHLRDWLAALRSLA